MVLYRVLYLEKFTKAHISFKCANTFHIHSQLVRVYSINNTLLYKGECFLKFEEIFLKCQYKCEHVTLSIHLGKK